MPDHTSYILFLILLIVDLYVLLHFVFVLCRMSLPVSSLITHLMFSFPSWLLLTCDRNQFKHQMICSLSHLSFIFCFSWYNYSIRLFVKGPTSQNQCKDAEISSEFQNREVATEKGQKELGGCFARLILRYKGFKYCIELYLYIYLALLQSTPIRSASSAS